MVRRRWFSLRGSALDRLVHRFQHRWETDRQFRATLSGLLALVMLLSLCAIMGAVAGVTNAALASLGGATARSYASGTPNTGVSLVKGAETFPTAVVTFSVGPSPAASPIPNSLTPLPTATGQPTATPTPVPTATPTGGAAAAIGCSGSSPAGSFALSPCPQIHGQTGTLVISAPRYPNRTLNIVFNLDGCSPGCTYLWLPGTYWLNSSGYVAISYQIPANALSSPEPYITGMINIQDAAAGDPTISITAEAVQ